MINGQAVNKCPEQCRLYPWGKRGKEMRKMTITEGLVELKLLNSRIVKATNGKDWIFANNIGEELDEEAKNKCQANLASVTDLIEQRKRIKSAIVKSNATTLVKVGDTEMTVAEAIERKESIQYDENLLRAWQCAYADMKNYVESQNQRVQSRIDGMLQQMAASGNADMESAQKAIVENYMNKNGYKLCDVLNLPELIEKKEVEIENFKKNVDLALSLSNAVTMIEV